MNQISLAPVTPDNWRTPLAVAPWQEAFVADRTTLLARAFAYRAFRSHAYFILHAGTAVGMALYYDEPQEKAYVLSQLFIDARCQRKGYAFAATDAILSKMRADGRWSRVILCYTKGNEAARRLYASFGFAENGLGDEEKIEMELAL